jgi:hypothetical protein
VIETSHPAAELMSCASAGILALFYLTGLLQRLKWWSWWSIDARPLVPLPRT